MHIYALELAVLASSIKKTKKTKNILVDVISSILPISKRHSLRKFGKPQSFFNQYSEWGQTCSRRDLNVFTGLPINAGEKGTSTQTAGKCHVCHMEQRSVPTASPSEQIAQRDAISNKNYFLCGHSINIQNKMNYPLC